MRWEVRQFGRLTLLAALWCTVLLGGAGRAAGQERGRIYGTVVDSTTSQPLPFATVSVLNTPMGANTQANGRFAIEDIPTGRRVVRASYIGYAPREIVLDITPGADLSVVFSLPKLEAVGTTQTIVVTADRTLVDVSEVSTVRELTGEEINKLAVDEVTEVVQRQVGVAGENEELHIRGGRTDETLIRIENVAMKNVVTGTAVGGTFSAKAVENLEVITGGYEAEYGQAISGIVNVQLKEAGYRRHNAVEYHTGRYDTQRLFLQSEGPLTPRGYPIPGRISYLLGVDMVASDTYLPSARNSTNRGFGMRRSLRSGISNSFSGLSWNYDDFLRPRQDNNVNLYAKFTWRLAPRHKLNLTFTKYVAVDHGFFRYRIGDEVSDASSQNTAYNWAYRDQMDQFPTYTEETSLQSLQWRWTISDNSYTTLALSHFFNNLEQAVQGKRPWLPGQAYDSFVSTGSDTFFISDSNGDYPQYGNLFTDRSTANATLTQRWQEHHELRTGWEASYYTIQLLRIDNPAEGESGGLGSVRDIYRVHPNEGALFLQNKFSYEGFAGHVGMRADYLFLGEQAEKAAVNQGTTGQDYLDNTHRLFGRRYKIFYSPRLAINHPITERDAMHFNFGHFIQWPRFVYYYSKISSRSSEAFPIEGNLDLDPERSVQFEFGVKHQFTDDDAIDITLFNKDTYDYPTATQPIEATRQRLVYINSDFSRTRGLEFVYQHRGSGRVSGNASYELQIATGKPADPNRIRQVDRTALETGNAEPELNEEYMPWNRPRRLQASFDLRFRKGDQVKLLGRTLPDRWGVNLYFSMRSGKPYTPTSNRGIRTGKRNSANAPSERSLDLKLNKYWEPRGTNRFGILLEVRNVFNEPPLRVVDSATGKAPTLGQGRLCDGCLTSDVDEGVVADRIANPAFYGEGRNFRLGLEVTF